MTDIAAPDDQIEDVDDTVEGARRAAEAGDLERWVHDFLASPGSDNAPLGEKLADEGFHWAAPVEVAFDRLHRLAGPENSPSLDEFDEDDIDRVDDMEESLDEEGWEPPPVIATRRGDQIVVEDGNHRIEGLRRAGRRSYWTVIGFETEAERDEFLTSD